MLLGAVAITFTSVWWIPFTPLVTRPALGVLVLTGAWVLYLIVRRQWMPALLLVGVAAGYVLFGVFQAFLGAPNFRPMLTVAPVEVTEIASVSRFRSCTAGDFSGRSADRARTVERDRTMLHRLTLGTTFGEGREIAVVAPADGVITRAKTFQEPDDVALGNGVTYLGNVAAEVELTISRAAPLGQWVVRFDRVYPTVDVGDHVSAGEVIGFVPPTDWANVQPAVEGASSSPVWFDVVMAWEPYIPLTGEHFASFVRYLSPEVQAAWVRVGLDPAKAEIPRVERDATPCRGVYDTNPDDVLVATRR